MQRWVKLDLADCQYVGRQQMTVNSAATLAAFEDRIDNVLGRLGATTSTSVDARTQKAYLNACRNGLRLVPGEWGHEASPKTRSYKRAAFKYWARVQLVDRYDLLCGREPTFGMYAMDSFPGGPLEVVADIEAHLDVIEQHIDCFDKPTAFSPKPPPRTKRRGLSSLPLDWRQRLWQRVPKRAVYRDAIAVLSVAGARPIELTNGVAVRLAGDGRTLIFRINGAKVTETQGQPIRVVRSVCTRPEADHLRALCAKAKGTVMIRPSCSPERLYDSVSHYGARTFPRHKYKVAPYSYRHQLAADLKTEGADRERIAAVLGHASTRTASWYGWKGRGRGSVQPSAGSGVVGVTVSRQIVLANRPLPKATGPKSIKRAMKQI
jgi:integrase